MPSKYQIISELASQTARDITSKAERYTDFLVTAANNYKYSFKEQLLIHAQKPDATACAEIETWNRLGRWVNKGTRGIALLVDRDKFIGQIMTSKSPVRSAEDIDETALSYAEIKALCAGNPHIKEKMDLDIDVSRLKLLKANHLSQRYALEDQIIKEFPQKIKSLEQRIDGYKADMAQLAQNTLPNEDGFSSMIMAGGTVTDKKAAGEAIIGLCKSMTNPDPIHIGEYRGFDMELFFDSFSREYKITLKHELRHTVTLGTDIFGNIQRLDNALNSFQEKLTACEAQLENTKVQLENAKLEAQKPFPQEDELKTKTARLNELNAMLNLDKRENEIVDGERAEEEPSRSSDDRER